MIDIDALRRELERPFADDEIRVVQLAIPGPARPRPDRVLDLEPAVPAIYWQADGGAVFAGLGAAVTVHGVGRDRVRAVDRAVSSLWRRMRLVAVDGVDRIAPRVFGGFAFLGGPQPPPWQAFGDAMFVLPQVLYGAGAAGGRLWVAVTDEQTRRGGLDRVLRRVQSVMAASSGAGPNDEGAPWRGGPHAAPYQVVGLNGGALDGRMGAADDWARTVSSIHDRIQDGRAEKIVAARVRELRFGSAPRPSSVLRRLGSVPAGARWAFRFGGATFLGATPERLVALRGLEVRTEALAGSADTDGPGRAEALRASVKEGIEHGLVVRAIVEAIGPLCDRLDYPAEPGIQRLTHVMHLRTPFEGTLSRAVPVLELVARLHPTPAVGGTPAAEALDWIALEEDVGRGWYAAPIGWLDADGDGDFMVALRSALLTGDRALLYAGAGIVRDSDPAAELAETDVKLRTMLDALGVGS
jgi:salicylate biosynthesis isochorismate synthase